MGSPIPEDIDYGTTLAVLAIGAVGGMLLRLALTVVALRRFPKISPDRRQLYVTVVGIVIGLLLYFTVLG